MVNMLGVRLTNQPTKERSLKARFEMNITIAGLLILWSLGFRVFVEIAVVPHHEWHNAHYYLPLVFAAPFLLRILVLCRIWQVKRGKQQSIAPISHA